MSSAPPPLQPYSPQEPPSPAAPPPKKGHGAAIAALVIVVLLVAVGGLYYLGDLPFAKPSSSSTASTGPGSFEQARPAANSAASGQSGGPWTLYQSIGLEFPSATKVNNNASASNDCALSTTAPTWAADTAGVGTGKTPIWLFEYGSSSAGSMGIFVLGGVASVAYNDPAGSGCGPAWEGVNHAIPASGIIDSSAAASVVFAHGGSTFLSAHAGAAVEDAIQSTTTTGSVWEISYSLCLVGTGTLSGFEPTFQAEVNATTGALLGSEAGTSPCGGSGSNPITLGMSESGAAVAGGNHYTNVSLDAISTGTMTTALLGFELTTSSDETVSTAAAVCSSATGGFAACTAPTSPNTWYVVLISLSGSWLASYPAQAGGTTWNGGTVTLIPGDTLSIVSTGTLAGTGDAFEAFGVGSTPVVGEIIL